MKGVDIMDKNYFYEVLYGVFEKDTEHFLSFIETEHLYMLEYEESEREIYKAEINNQIVNKKHVYNTCFLFNIYYHLIIVFLEYYLQRRHIFHNYLLFLQLPL